MARSIRRRIPARRRNPSGRYEVYAGSGGGDRVFSTDSSSAANSFSRSLRSKGEQTYVFDTETRKASRPNPSKSRVSLEPPPPLPREAEAYRGYRKPSQAELDALRDRYWARVDKQSLEIERRWGRANPLKGRRRNPSRRPSRAKYRTAPAWIKAKWERCVKKVKARGGKYNAFAVCTASISKKRGKYHYARPRSQRGGKVISMAAYRQAKRPAARRGMQLARVASNPSFMDRLLGMVEVQRDVDGHGHWRRSTSWNTVAEAHEQAERQSKGPMGIPTRVVDSHGRVLRTFSPSRNNPSSYKRTYSRKGTKVTVSQLPEAQIKWIVDRFHVGTPDAEVAADIARRAKHWPPTMAEKAVKYAIAHHHHNQKLYTSVMRGPIARFNPSRRRGRYPSRPARVESSYYAEYDKDHGAWLVLGGDTGHAYGSFANKEEAEIQASQMSRGSAILALSRRLNPSRRAKRKGRR